MSRAAANDRPDQVPSAPGIFARKGAAAPLVDRLGGAEAPEDVVAENRAAFSRMTIINERSSEAGYPENPTPEELAALEAEQAAMQAGRNPFASAKSGLASTASAIMGLSLGRHGAPSPDAIVTGAEAALLDQQARAVAALPLRQFLRLKLAAAGLSMSEDEIIRRALEAFLDRCAIDDLSDCDSLADAAARCESAISARSAASGR